MQAVRASFARILLLITDWHRGRELHKLPRCLCQLTFSETITNLSHYMYKLPLSLRFNRRLLQRSCSVKLRSSFKFSWDAALLHNALDAISFKRCSTRHLYLISSAWVIFTSRSRWTSFHKRWIPVLSWLECREFPFEFLLQNLHKCCNYVNKINSKEESHITGLAPLHLM